MNLADYHQTVHRFGGRGYPLNSRRRQAVDHSSGPLWIVVGPGTDRPEVLVTRALKLVCVDQGPPGGDGRVAGIGGRFLPAHSAACSSPEL
jgi:DNA helicase-2/ATP-dependent DNA helicase PcrA